MQLRDETSITRWLKSDLQLVILSGKKTCSVIRCTVSSAETVLTGLGHTVLTYCNTLPPFWTKLCVKNSHDTPMCIYTPEDTLFILSLFNTHTHTGDGQAVTGPVAWGRWCTRQGAGWVEGSVCGGLQRGWQLCLLAVTVREGH